MMDEKYAAEQLRECPFCGKRPDLDDQDTLYPSGVGWKWDEELQMRTYHSIGDVPRDQWCWVMHCPTNSGGCGAEVHGDSREEAITKWNRRAHADALEENARLKAELAKLRQHAEAMIEVLEWLNALGGKGLREHEEMRRVIDSYRRDYPEM